MNDSTMKKVIDTIGIKARRASQLLVDTKQSSIDACLREMAALIDNNKSTLLHANKKDIAAARLKKIPDAMIERLTLTDKTFTSIKKGLSEVAAQKSLVGSFFEERTRPNGLHICKMHVPIGVIAIIYESRPNVTVDAAAICLKSRNSVILRGGSEAIHSNTALAALFSQACKNTGLSKDVVQLIPTTERTAIDLLLKQVDTIDLVIPRGGEGLIRTVVEKSHIPVIKHYKGVCHVYISKKANIQKAISIIINAKTQRPSVCNAMETLLLDKSLSNASKKRIVDAMIEKGVVLFGDNDSRLLSRSIKKASEADWYAEYLDLRCAIKIVDGVKGAIEHINKYGSHHTDTIVTESKAEGDAFIVGVDSSSVMVNASTRFADGGEYGLGAEIGISTDKLHSRGPMGVADLTTYKWVVRGNGQIRN